MEEVWKEIEGYEGLYEISSHGRVKSKKKSEERFLKPWKRSNYLLVDLWLSGRRDVRSIHVLVHQAFNADIPEGFCIHHKDGNKFNNHKDNLEAVSYTTHNMTHHGGKTSWNKGLKMPPEIHKKAWETRRRNKQNGN